MNPIEEDINFLIDQIKPIHQANSVRNGVTSFLKNVIKTKFPQITLVQCGSSCFRTYLPDSDLDLILFYTSTESSEPINENIKYLTGLFQLLCEEIYLKEQSSACTYNSQSVSPREFTIRNIEFINARTKLLHCLINNINVDITLNQLGSVMNLLFLEQIDEQLQNQHLFKRSLLLIKCWCLHESQIYCGMSILASKEGMLSSYALSVLVLFLFHHYSHELKHPFDVLRKFLAYYGTFQWENYVLTLDGPQPIVNGNHNHSNNASNTTNNTSNTTTTTTPSTKKSPTHNDNHIHNPLFHTLLQPLKQRYQAIVQKKQQQQQSHRQHSPSSSSSCSSSSYSNNNQGRFSIRCCNIQDPIDDSNNLGISVSRQNLIVIKKAMILGSQRLEQMIIFLSPPTIPTSSSSTSTNTSSSMFTNMHHNNNHNNNHHHNTHHNLNYAHHQHHNNNNNQYPPQSQYQYHPPYLINPPPPPPPSLPPQLAPTMTNNHNNNNNNNNNPNSYPPERRMSWSKQQHQQQQNKHSQSNNNGNNNGNGNGIAYPVYPFLPTTLNTATNGGNNTIPAGYYLQQQQQPTPPLGPTTMTTMTNAMMPGTVIHPQYLANPISVPMPIPTMPMSAVPPTPYYYDERSVPSNGKINSVISSPATTSATATSNNIPPPPPLLPPNLTAPSTIPIQDTISSSATSQTTRPIPAIAPVIPSSFSSVPSANHQYPVNMHVFLMEFFGMTYMKYIFHTQQLRVDLLDHPLQQQQQQYLLAGNVSSRSNSISTNEASIRKYSEDWTVHSSNFEQFYEGNSDSDESEDEEDVMKANMTELYRIVDEIEHAFDDNNNPITIANQEEEEEVGVTNVDERQQNTSQASSPGGASTCTTSEMVTPIAKHMVYHKQKHASNHQGGPNTADDSIIRTLSASPSTESTTSETMSSFSEEDQLNINHQIGNNEVQIKEESEESQLLKKGDVTEDGEAQQKIDDEKVEEVIAKKDEVVVGAAIMAELPTKESDTQATATIPTTITTTSHDQVTAQSITTQKIISTAAIIAASPVRSSFSSSSPSIITTNNSTSTKSKKRKASRGINQLLSPVLASSSKQDVMEMRSHSSTPTSSVDEPSSNNSNRDVYEKSTNIKEQKKDDNDWLLLAGRWKFLLSQDIRRYVIRSSVLLQQYLSRLPMKVTTVPGWMIMIGYYPITSSSSSSINTNTSSMNNKQVVVPWKRYVFHPMVIICSMGLFAILISYCSTSLSLSHIISINTPHPSSSASAASHSATTTISSSITNPLGGKGSIRPPKTAKGNIKSPPPAKVSSSIASSSSSSSSSSSIPTMTPTMGTITTHTTTSDHRSQQHHNTHYNNNKNNHHNHNNNQHTYHPPSHRDLPSDPSRSLLVGDRKKSTAHSGVGGSSSSSTNDNSVGSKSAEELDMLQNVIINLLDFPEYHDFVEQKFSKYAVATSTSATGTAVDAEMLLPTTTNSIVEKKSSNNDDQEDVDWKTEQKSLAKKAVTRKVTMYQELQKIAMAEVQQSQQQQLKQYQSELQQPSSSSSKSYEETNDNPNMENYLKAYRDQHENNENASATTTSTTTTHWIQVNDTIAFGHYILLSTATTSSDTKPDTITIGTYAVSLSQYLWMKDGLNLTTTAYPIYTIKRARYQDAGLYECYQIVSDTITIASLKLIARTIIGITKKPKVHTRPFYYEIKLGDPYFFQLDVEGLPFPQFRWYKNGYPLANHSHAGILIEQMNESNAGTYTCEVWNIAGQLLWLEATLHAIT